MPVSAPASHLWPQVQANFRNLFAREIYDMWISPLRCKEIQNEKIVLVAPNEFVAIWIQDNYLELIAREISKVVEDEIRVEIQVEPAGQVGEEPKGPSVDRSGVFRPASSGPTIKSRHNLSYTNGLNPKNKFENFVVGGGNELAHAASIAVANAPAQAYNPLFIYGETGLGKTHLMHAVAHHVLDTNPSARVAYISTEKFTNKFIRGIQENSLTQFRRQFRKVDLLLIDDIQFLSGRERIQEEFFHTFNELFENQKQIFLTSDRPASEIAKMQERLISRFQWGLVADIQSPDLDTRLAILGKKARALDLDLSEDILQFLAEKVTRNVRRMEGALTRISGYQRLIRDPLSIEVIERLLQDILQEELQLEVTIDKIQQKVADYFHIRVADILSRRKPARIVVPRQVGMYLARMLTNHSLTQIGDAFGGRDHGTVIHSIRIVETLMDQDPSVKRSVDYLTKQLSQT